MTERNESIDLTSLVAEVVAAYVSRNPMESTEIPAFVQMIHRSLGALSSGKSYLLSSRSEPAVSVEHSIHPDYIVCLEDGRKLKMLKRHLKTAYNMTPEQYRERWNLPTNYPMVAPNYAKRRSSIAKDIGLGTHPKGHKRAAA
ncbi:MucR family transcriptional regulator [Kamptonema cortianum]|nr:MucR family transcriptional regulator [Geitlerinema splendidum]MDK3155616.1 MucR family transcriptional regulator [Kamptonema cortianum]